MKRSPPARSTSPGAPASRAPGRRAGPGWPRPCPHLQFRPRRHVASSRSRAQSNNSAMSELTALTLAAARDALRRREISAAELTAAHLAAIDAARELNAFL